VAGQKHDGLGKVSGDSTTGVGIGIGAGTQSETGTGVEVGESIETGAIDNTTNETSEEESVSSSSLLPDAKVIVAMDIFESSRMQP